MFCEIANLGPSGIEEIYFLNRLNRQDECDSTLINKGANYTHSAIPSCLDFLCSFGDYGTSYYWITSADTDVSLKRYTLYGKLQHTLKTICKSCRFCHQRLK